MQRNTHQGEASFGPESESKDGAAPTLITFHERKLNVCFFFGRDELGRVVLGDVITAIDGKEIKLQRDLFEILDERRPGDKIKLEVLRNGQRMAFEVELGGRQLSGTE